MEFDTKTIRELMDSITKNNPDSKCGTLLPPWGHKFSSGIFPIFVIKNISEEPAAIFIGTAFCISKLGFIVSALHNVSESLKYHYNGENLRQRKKLPQDYSLTDMNLAVFHHQVTGQNRYTGNMWPLEKIHGAPPADVILGFPQFNATFQYDWLPITFALPRIKSKVFCIGYSNASFPPEGVPIQGLRKGEIKWHEVYEHKFQVIEGTVTRIFTNRFAKGFIDGPCFSIDVEVPHGMSGGPVFNEDGHVCGVVSAGATKFFSKSRSLVSPFYPTLMTNVKFGMKAKPISIEAERPIFDLIAQKFIKTDGSETLVHITSVNGKYRIGPMIIKEDYEFVHEDFSGYQNKQEAPRVGQEVFKLHYKK